MTATSPPRPSGAELTAAGDDAVLPATRWLAGFIIPFLVVAFVVLYPVPSANRRWFAWEIQPTMTPMVLGAAYLGGAYFFARVVAARSWAAVHAGFLPVALFAGTLGVTTVLHWDRFNHDHLAFWLWAGLYFTTPALVLAVWWRNRSQRLPAGESLPTTVRAALAAAGLASLLLGLYLVAVPARAADVWPWPVSPLTARVMGAVLMLGVAAVVLAADGRRDAAPLMAEVAVVMVALILVAAVRARDEFFTDRPLTWMLGGGLVAVLAGAAWLARRARPA